MKNFFKGIVVGVAVLLLHGCFAVEQIRDKVYEDCYINPDNIKELSQDEYQRLARKCGWDKQKNNTASTKKSRLNIERLCRETVVVPMQGKQGEQVLEKLPNGMSMQYSVLSKESSDLKVFYPNGVMETHTRFSNGKAEGWSEGYYPSGKVRTRFFYQDGRVKQYEIYSEEGSIIEKNELDCD